LLIHIFKVILRKKQAMREALFWSSEQDQKVKCLLCPHECRIIRGKAGICRVRENLNGTLYSMVYGEPVAIHSDPIEKKPLYHFHPGKQILSIGTFGCNFHCTFCQNYHLSQNVHDPLRVIKLNPEDLARKAAGIKGNIGVAYTYNEPTVFYEYMLDTAEAVHSTGMKNVMVSNGFINPEPLTRLMPLMDAFNIDLKSIREDFYRKLTGGNLEPVLETLKNIMQAGKHLEITHLVIPGLNDSMEEFHFLTDWIVKELGVDIPLHLSAYHPAFRLSQPPTPLSVLQQFAAGASEKLHFVFTGNVSNNEFSATFCPHCHGSLIKRYGYNILITGLTGEGRCNSCGTLIPVRM
jgi:pyruvate formate lyase activating enzyme